MLASATKAVSNGAHVSRKRSRHEDGSSCFEAAEDEESKESENRDTSSRDSKRAKFGHRNGVVDAFANGGANGDEKASGANGDKKASGANGDRKEGENDFVDGSNDSDGRGAQNMGDTEDACAVIVLE